MKGYNFNNTEDLFAPLTPDDVPRLTVSPSAVEAGEINAVGRAARERALQAQRMRHRVHRTKQRELSFDTEEAA